MLPFIAQYVGIVLLALSFIISTKVDAELIGVDYYQNASLLYGRQDTPEQPIDITTAGARFPRCRSPCTPGSCSSQSCGAQLGRRDTNEDSTPVILPWVDEKPHLQWLRRFSKRYFRINLQTRYVAPVQLDNNGDPVLDAQGRQISLYSTAQVARLLRATLGIGIDGNAPNENWNNDYGPVIPLADDDVDGILNTRPVGVEQRFGANSFQIGSGFLHGCTVVTIVSRRAVWMAHFWEEYSHGSVDYEENTVDPQKIIDQQADLPAFRERVLNFIRGTVRNDRAGVRNSADYENGRVVGEFLKPIGVPPTRNYYINAGDDTQAFIMTPAAEGSATGGPALYGSRITEMENLLGTRFNARVTTYTYAPLEYLYDAERGRYTGVDAANAGIDQRGNALFQFDPDSDKQGGRAWRLFYEAAVSSGKVA